MTTIKTSPDTITTAQIRALREEAMAAGDHHQADICAVALASHETADDDGSEMVGPNGKPMTRSVARAECARVIGDAQAQV